jgi:hypothetical protein
MPVIGHDPAACRIRNAKAARRGINSVPVILSARFPGPVDTNDQATEKGLRVITARGTLPRTEAAAVERINKVRGDGHDPLTAEQVYVTYAEAGNSNFISKYFMFLGDSSLRNIARRAERSMAFMNSHRTGGLSTPAELPYGRTFAGRFERAITPDGRRFSRTMLGVYMLRGEYPNGQNGPSTDSLYAGIKAGTIFDVSLGIQGGDEFCDVCGNPLGAYNPETYEDICPHIPGTHRKMTEEEIADSLARGVPGGVCSFTLEDATAGEVSPVFDGAVPGAGFRKALRAARARDLSASDLEEARRSFGPLARRRDFSPEPPDRGRPAPNPRGPAMPNRKSTVTLANLARVLGELGIEVEDPDEGAAPPAPPPARPATLTAIAAAPTPAPERPAGGDDDRHRLLEEQVNRLEQALTAQRAAHEAEARAQRKATVLAQAATWADAQVRLGAAIPAEREGLVGLHAQAAMDDHESPAQVQYRDGSDTPKLGSRVDALAATFARRGRHDFTREHVAPAAAAGAAPAGSPPLFEFSGPAGPQADPLGDRMVAAAEKFQSTRNSHKNNGT